MARLGRSRPNQALVVTAPVLQTIAIGQADEADAAQSIVPQQLVVIAQAIEADISGTIAPLALVAFGLAEELEIAQSALVALVLGHAAEAETAGALTPTQLVVLGTAAETSAAGWITLPVSTRPWPPRAGSTRLVHHAVSTVRIVNAIDADTRLI